jgi:hypothetical protein
VGGDPAEYFRKKPQGPERWFRALSFFVAPAFAGSGEKAVANYFFAFLSFFGFFTSFLSRLLPLPMTSSLCQPRVASSHDDAARKTFHRSSW